MTTHVARALRPVSLIAISALALLWGKGSVDPVNADPRGVSIHGYDPVAYFEQGAAVEGVVKFKSEWMGVGWLFTTAENKALFEADPGRYAPQYGGYCAWAVSNGYTADVDPEAWTIRDEKLYLNYSKSIRSRWLRDVRERIAAGDRNWPSLHR